MAEQKIPGGYFMIARKIIDSEIMKKPPLYMKVWIYLLSRAQHSQYNQLKRGQLRTSIPEIQEACSWYVGARKVTPTIKEVRCVLDWMRGKSRKSSETSLNGTTNGAMIGTTKGTHGMLVTIENYDVYQTSANYERHTESHNERHTETSSNSTEGAEYKQECFKNVQEITEDEAFWNMMKNESASQEKTPEQKYQDEIENYFRAKSGYNRFDLRTADLKALVDLTKKKIPLDEVKKAIDYSVQYLKSQGKKLNSLSYVTTIIFDRLQEKEETNNQNRVVPFKTSKPSPDRQLPESMRHQHTTLEEMTPEEKAAHEEKVKIIQEKIQRLNEMKAKKREVSP